jgi:hypothetical protein
MLMAALNKHGLLGDAEDTQPFASLFLLVAGAMSGAPSHFAAKAESADCERRYPGGTV